MKTNTIKIITTVAATALIAGLASLQVSDSLITAATVALGYLAVVSLVAIAASDYRGSSRSYSA